MFLFKNKKAEAERIDRETMRKFHKEEIVIIDYLAEGVLVFDESNRLSLANSRIEKFFGVKKKDILGKTIFELNQFPNLSLLSSFLAGKIYHKGKEKLRIRDNFVLDVTVVPMMAEGERIGALIILDDVTPGELINKAKSEFVALSAHQLWTPTSAVKWSLQMLLKGELGDLNKKQKELIEKTYEANNKAIKLVGDLLNVAQIEAGKYLSNVALSDIAEIISSSIKDYKRKIEKKGLKLEFKKLKEQMPRTMMDKAKMRIAIGNILNNSIKYTSSGGKITVSLKKNDNNKEIEVQISDTGSGIPQDEQERVFTKFFRGSNIIQIDTEGTGLGLYITKNIIEAHNGKIWFISEEGKGTTFCFTIPLKKEFGEFITGKFY